MARRDSYIDVTYGGEKPAKDSCRRTSFSTGPVHNAVRRMTELIDLENFEGYFDEFLREAPEDVHEDEGFDDLPDEKADNLDEREVQSGFIKIESYTKIVIERPDDKPKVLPSSKVVNVVEKGRGKKESGIATKKKQKVRASSRVSHNHLEKNAWGRDCTVARGRVDHYNTKDKSKKSLVVKFFCGINHEYKWYSLKGKGLCLILPMAISYVVLCVALLPFIFAAAAVSAFVLCAGVLSYLTFATKKVGVSSDEDSDKSCLEAIWWWA